MQLTKEELARILQSLDDTINGPIPDTEIEVLGSVLVKIQRLYDMSVTSNDKITIEILPF